MYQKIILGIFIMCFAVLPCTQINAEEGDLTMTRAEFANAMIDTYEYITQEFSLPIEERPAFSDISQSPFQIRILQAHIKGFMNGVGDETFLPDEKITKCQAAVALYRLMQCLNAKYDSTQEQKQINILDIETVPDWGREAITFMVSTSLMSLKESKICPNDLISKTELNEIREKIKNIFVISDGGERIDFQTFLERMNKNN